MLCQLCQSIDFSASPLHQDEEVDFPIGDTERGKEYLVFQHHSSIEALYSATNEGCHLCCQIRSELLHIRGHERDDEHHRGSVEIRYYPKISGESKIPLPKELMIVVRTPIRNVKLLFDLVEYSSSLSVLLDEKARSNDQSTGCRGNIKLAMTWLSQCLTSHGFCTMSTSAAPPLPSRVLDVQAAESSDGLRLRSCDGRHGAYITLSHVWGKAQVITTTMSTIENRMSSIAIEDLSRTFQDAVFVARSMNVRYLWIDSICIIQDSFEDWAKESSKMGEYYMNSLFNISAISAFDGSEGCFMARNPLQTTPCPIKIRFPGVIQDTSKTMFLRSGSGWDPVTQIAQFQRPPLWQRAWVVQERLLSPRLLQFSSMQLSWKCREMVASEKLPEGARDSYMSQGDIILRQALVGLKKFNSNIAILDGVDPALALANGTSEELAELYDAWYDLVTLYGKCTLTKESDIFPAISGIAKAIATATGNRYVAGLWENDLHRGLLWSAPDSTSSRPDLRRYRAPSWSWASLRATCTFYVREISQAGLKVNRDHFKIDAIVDNKSEMNPYGELTAAELKITGLLKRAHPKGNDQDIAFNAVPGNHDRYSLFDLEEQRTVGYYFADNINMRFLTEIWCCPVMTEEEIVQRGNASEVTQRPARPIEAKCLALVALNDTDRIYMRVGNVWIEDFSWFSYCNPSYFSII